MISNSSCTGGQIDGWMVENENSEMMKSEVIDVCLETTKRTANAIKII
jgi:hypothetical protein